MKSKIKSETKWVEQKKKCVRCGKLKVRDSFRMLGNFNPSLFSVSKFCKVCEAKADVLREIGNDKFRENQHKIRKEFVEKGGVLKEPMLNQTNKVKLSKKIEIGLTKGKNG